MYSCVRADPGKTFTVTAKNHVMQVAIKFALQAIKLWVCAVYYQQVLECLYM